jgi:hypothetical protein
MVFRLLARLPSWSWPRLRRRSALALGAVFVLAGFGLVGFATSSGTARAAQTDNEALGMFGEMMPVFTSPRCVNCHGGINPFKGDSHEAGAIDVPLDADGDMSSDDKDLAVCAECHTAANGRWHTAPKSVSFVGKDTLALCRQMRSNDSAANFVSHITNDDLIGLAFVGQRGVGDDSAFGPLAPDPPPMSREEMIAAAKHWVEDGKAGCGSAWNGTIKKTSTLKTHSESPATRVILDGASDTSVAVTITDGQATATMHYEGHQFSDPAANGGCNFQHNTTGADGSGPVDVQILGEAESGGYFVTFYIPAGTGTWHRDIGTGPSPTCKPVQMSPVPDEKYTVQQSFSVINIKIDPDNPNDPSDPNHIFGHLATTELDGSESVYVWDLTKD